GADGRLPRGCPPRQREPGRRGHVRHPADTDRTAPCAGARARRAAVCPHPARHEAHRCRPRLPSVRRAGYAGGPRRPPGAGRRPISVRRPAGAGRRAGGEHLRPACPAPAVCRCLPPGRGGRPHRHSEDVLQMLLREEVQLAMVRALRHPDIESIPLYEEGLVLVVPPGHAFARRSKVGIADVASERLIFFDRTSSYYELTQAFFLSLGVTPREVMELDNIEPAKRMVQRRLGIALLPRTAVAGELAAKTLTQVTVTDAP